MILPPFELLQLPNLAKSTQNSLPIYSGEQHLLVGVSGCAINKLGMRPPQVLSAHSVAPGITVTSLLPTESQIVVFGSIDRGKFHLNLLNPSEKGNTEYLNKAASEVPEEIGAIYISADNSQLVTVGRKTSTLTGYSASDLKETWKHTANENAGLVFSFLLTSESALDSSSTTNFFVLTQCKDSLLLTTYALDARDVFALTSVKIQGVQTEEGRIHQSRFSVHRDLLYQATPSHIYVYRIPDGLMVTSFEVESPANVTGIVALPNSNIALGRGNTVELLDCTFQSHTSSIKLSGKGPIDLLAFSESTSTIILCQNQRTLMGLSVTPTRGTLLESISKGSANKAENFALAEIFNGFTDQDASKYRTTAETQLLKATEEMGSILVDLKDAIKSRNGLAFAEIITYLKNSDLEWVGWHASGDASGPEEQDLVFEETDRNVDKQLINEICALAFLPRFKPYLPIGVAVYFLTHPLFPTGEPKFEHLLRSLEKSDAMLYRQALVSLVGITAKDLVLGLVSSDEETFMDAAVRLQEDYGSQQILQGIKNAFGDLRSISSLSILIRRLSRHQETIGLICPFIDAIGLLAWDVNHIKQLQAKLKWQIEVVISCSRADAAITEQFSTLGLSASEVAKLSTSEEHLCNKVAQRKHLTTEPEPRYVPKYSYETLVL